ncbi:DUF1850 domain-containing protein [Fusobacterium perfoetens]|uniref:DUF1850 domain-containing protein n=1 Tax=Fusobacterium perfoetens TaxID=852 RepID=UPI000487212F|nr:DUF1850 domain-containing protein [Fusobacterium perfoetens]MCI6153214.1 DUF1850 domain-containing protein [Fusobacterium perfoetens]MDY3238315.1 DUF1850 domain-containing protein [Fusobacterium perfoetens]
MKKKKLFLGLIIFGILFSLKLYNEKILLIYNIKTNQIYIKEKVKNNDFIEYKWIHSFEHIPWKEMFQIQKDNSLILKEISVAGFGAGIPENKGKVEIQKDGLIHMTNINQKFENIQWINSKTALVYISLNNKILINGYSLPHHELMKLEIRRRLSL